MIVSLASSTGQTVPAAKPERFDGKPGEAPTRPCPICGKPAAFADRPFCSKRCADVDLYRWLGGVYTIPVSPDRDAESGGLSEWRVAKTSEP